MAAGTGFTDSLIRRGRYPDFKGPLPLTPGYELVGIVEKTGPGVTEPREGQMVADLCVIGGYTQYAIRPARFLVPVPDGIDPAEAVCIPLAYLTAFQMLTRCRGLPPGMTILVIRASGTIGSAMPDLARHLGLRAIGTCSAAHVATVERAGATAIDYRARSFACLARGGFLVGDGSQAMAEGHENLLAAGIGMIRIKVWGALGALFGDRRATLFDLLRNGAIYPVVVDRPPLEAARAVHVRIDAGGGLTWGAYGARLPPIDRG